MSKVTFHFLSCIDEDDIPCLFLDHTIEQLQGLQIKYKTYSLK